MKTKKKENAYLACAGIVLLAIIGVMIWWGANRSHQSEQQSLASESVKTKVPQSQIITVEKVITAEVVEDGLRDLGKLVTEEYYFTDVLSYSSALKLFKTIQLPFTTSSFLVSYDGVVTAGVDFEKIQVQKDEENKIITVTLPASEIFNVDIDPESFVSHTEKTGIGNPISVSDFNQSLIELETSAREKAVEKGLLHRADENAKNVISHFVDSLLEPGSYAVRFAKQ